jgi:hypothetical protein
VEGDKGKKRPVVSIWLDIILRESCLKCDHSTGIGLNASQSDDLNANLFRSRDKRFILRPSVKPWNNLIMALEEELFKAA